MEMKYRRQLVFKLASIFCLSVSLFIYEVLVTRLFSTILSYHFVFLTTSLAILGMGLGGLIVYKIDRVLSQGKLTLILALSYIGTIMLIYKLPYIEFFMIYTLLASMPFVIGGMILALAFLKDSEISHKLYFADLIGSTIGSVIILPLMDVLGFMSTVATVGFLGSLSVILLTDKSTVKKLTLGSTLLAFLLLSLIIQRDVLLQLERDFTAYLTAPGTVLEYNRKNGNPDAKVSFTKWDSISRTDVIQESEDEKTIVTDGGANAPMVKFHGDLKTVDYMKQSINYLPFTLGDNKDTLVIGSGGGKDVIFALLGGSKAVDAVEINPSTIDAVNAFKTFNGDIYNYEGVNLFIEDGRNFIEKTDKLYNNIYLSMVMTNAVSNGGLSLSESYIYTREAFKSYLEHLKTDGYLSLMFHSSHDMLRAIHTGIESLLEMGIQRKEIPNHFIAINHMTNTMIKQHPGKIKMPIVIFKKTPFTEEEITRIYIAAQQQNREIINMPGIRYMDLYSQYSLGKIDLEDIYKDLPANVAPVKDDRPFFYDFNKGVPTVLLLLLSTILVVIRIVYVKIKRKKNLLKPGFYFGAIGMGFMMIEIPLVQKSILFLGDPSKAFSYTLFALLLSCGIGSYFSNKQLFNKLVGRKKIIFFAIPILVILLQITLPMVTDAFRWVDNEMKLLILTMLLFPLGFLMGMPFPQGIVGLRKKRLNKHIPLMWGINGVTSVLGAVVALIISMTLGFTWTLSLGALIYLLLGIKFTER